MKLLGLVSYRSLTRVLAGLLLVGFFSQLFAFTYAADSYALSSNDTDLSIDKANEYDSAYSGALNEDNSDDNNDYYYHQRKIEGPVRFSKTVKVRRGQPLNVTCPVQINFDSEYYESSALAFKFKWQLFNSSFLDMDQTPDKNLMLSHHDYVNKFSKLHTFKNSTRTIDFLHFNDSGRYYCVYENVNHEDKFKRYLIKSFLYIVFDDIQLIKNINDSVELETCTDNGKDIDSILWLSNGAFFNSTQHRASLTLNTSTKALTVKLNDTDLFLVSFRCQNMVNGAFRTYNIECANCDAYSPPIISPSKPLASKGSTTHLNCERSNKQDPEPDSVLWFKSQGNEDVDSSLKNAISFNNLLEISNATEKDSGWYYCCLAYSRLTAEEKREKLKNPSSDDNEPENGNFQVGDKGLNEKRFEQLELKCSSVFVTVQDNDPKIKPNRSRNILIIVIAAISLIFLLGWVIISYILYQKLQIYKDKQKAQTQLHTNLIYDRAPGDDDDMEAGNRRRLNKARSESIECLLEQSEIKKWQIPIKQIDFGKVIGQGAFGVVMCARLNSSSSFSVPPPPSPTKIPKRRDTDSGMGSDMAGSLIQFSESGSVIEDDKITPREKLNSSNSNRSTNETTIDSNSTSKSVAIKKLKDNARSENFYELFKELQLMFEVGHHPFIINLIGFSVENDSLFIVTEFAEHGNLKDFLRKYHDPTSQNADRTVLTKERLMAFAFQIALGMKFLHSKKVLHRDLAARNILVEDYDHVKIADFGLARNIQQEYYYIQHKDGKVPLKWMSPEALSLNKISMESDVWSYGVLLWEIYSYGCSPYPLLPVEDIFSKLKDGYRMEKPTDCDNFIYNDVMLNCWKYNPKERPSFKDIGVLFQDHVIKGPLSTNDYLAELAKYSEEDTVANENDEKKTDDSEHEKNSLNKDSDDKKFAQREARLASSSTSITHSSSIHPSISSATSSKSDLSDTKSPLKTPNEIKLNDLHYDNKSLTSRSIIHGAGEKSDSDRLLGSDLQKDRLGSSSISFEFNKDKESAIMLLSPTKSKYSKDDFDGTGADTPTDGFKPHIPIFSKTSY